MTVYPGEHPIGPLLRGIVQLQRDARFKDSPQITLGELIRQIEALPLTYEGQGWEDGKRVNKTLPKKVWFDFGQTYPGELQSWRGSYAELAITFDYDGLLTNMGRPKHSIYSNDMTAERFLTLLREAVGKTFEGYKGGDFTMDESTPVWVANYGDSGNTGVVGVIDTGYSIVIRTGWCEF